MSHDVATIEKHVPLKFSTSDFRLERAKNQHPNHVSPQLFLYAKSFIQRLYRTMFRTFCSPHHFQLDTTAIQKI
jgi:hypothetical protein